MSRPGHYQESYILPREQTINLACAQTETHTYMHNAPTCVRNADYTEHADVWCMCVCVCVCAWMYAPPHHLLLEECGKFCALPSFCPHPALHLQAPWSYMHSDQLTKFLDTNTYLVFFGKETICKTRPELHKLYYPIPKWWTARASKFCVYTARRGGVQCFRALESLWSHAQKAQGPFDKGAPWSNKWLAL